MEIAMMAATQRFVEEIRQSETFREYDQQKEELKKHPELVEQVREYRRKNYELQTSTQEDDLYEMLDAFEKEYEKFRENPYVDKFLRAELGFCRMVQEINAQITSKLEFE